ncbi:MAG: hypothetical protein CMH83_01190 [Nocardioides sp.]|nr:hypothetical protein [Nocardioides sp.]
MTTTRAPIPRAVYWRRRVFVLGTVLALVLITVNLVRGGDPEPPMQASTAGASTSDTASGDTGGTASGDADASGIEKLSKAERKAQRKARRQARKQQQPAEGGSADSQRSPLPQPEPEPPDPEGPCQDSDVVITPVVRDAVAGSPVTLRLRLRTATATACTWTVSADTLAVKVADDEGDVWSTRECPSQLDDRSVVVRKDFVTVLDLTWGSRYSDAGCPKSTEWAQPGDYRLYAAALAGEPGEAEFVLEQPVVESVTRSRATRRTTPARG